MSKSMAITPLQMVQFTLSKDQNVQIPGARGRCASVPHTADFLV